MKRILLLISATLFALISLLLAFSVLLYSPEYMRRILLYGESDVKDYQIFSERTIHRSNTPFSYPVEIRETLADMSVSYESKGRPVEQTLSQLLSLSNTTALIIIHQDAVVFEQYAEGNTRESITTSFSAAKSIVSLLMGIAIEGGYIQSVHDPISTYLQELEGEPLGDITIEELLRMRSKIRYREGLLWFSDDAKTYYMPDLRGWTLNNLKIDQQYDGRFHYNNYHPILLGIILERSTQQNVAGFFERTVWHKIGAEYDASWSLDSTIHGFEKMESGFNFRPIDLAKIGSMLLHMGKWDGDQVVIVRTGSSSGNVDWWPDVLRHIAGMAADS